MSRPGKHRPGEGPVLEVRDLSVAVGRKRVLSRLNLSIGPGEVHVLLGPNGGGKTTLLMSIMGMPGYRVTGGRILFMGRDVTGSSVDERARAGIALAFQKPPAVRGITLGSLTEKVLDRRGGGGGGRAAALAAGLRLEPHLRRDLNVGLSGGEMKRSEVLQLLAMEPVLALFDEPESGVDLDNISVVGESMRSVLAIGPGRSRKAGLIVTHTGHILRFVPADRGHVLMGGSLVCRGHPQVLFEDVKKHGFEGCLTCPNCRSG